jgi:pSer/pThr/pTyr-binding forkhead associated (FHA) protein
MVPDDDSTSGIDDLSEPTRMVSIEELRGPGPMGNIKVDPLPKNTQAALEVVEGRGKGHTHAIDKPMVILGRVSGVADIAIIDDAVSRHHAAIAYQGGRFMLYDMGSTNGTLVNDASVTACELTTGARIRIGDTVLVLHVKTR